MTSLPEHLAVPERLPFDRAELADHRRPRDTVWSIVEAYLAILVSAEISRADSHTVYKDSLVPLVSGSRALSSLSWEEIAHAHNAIKRRMLPERSAALLAEACSTLPYPMRLPIFAQCADILLTDGQLVSSEADHLAQLAEWLGLDDQAVKRVVDVLALKRRY